MRNRYGAKCVVCGHHVAPNEGESNKVGDVWKTVHDDCNPNYKSSHLKAQMRAMDDTPLNPVIKPK